MNFKISLTILILNIFAFSQSYSQIDSIFIQDYKIQTSDTGKLFLRIDNNNFIKNNEYFGPIAEGYTLLGFNITPKFVYTPSTKLKLSFGGNFLTYYGRKNEVEARLLLAFQYKIHKKLDFVLGNIYGTTNHKLIEPLFDFERYLNNNVENGIQFLWNSDRIFADLWLDWEQQILQGDPFQEQFNVGLSSEFLIIDRKIFQLSIPFQNLIRHEGGQINSNSSKPLITIFNNATGIKLSKPLNTNLIKQVNLASYVVSYEDLSPNKQQMFIDGIASYTILDLTTSIFDLNFGYWYGEQYIAPIGNPLFESYSRTKFYVEEPNRQLVIGKINYAKNIFKGIDLSVRFESYYDILGSNLEYTWAVMFIFNDKFFLKDL